MLAFCIPISFKTLIVYTVTSVAILVVILHTISYYWKILVLLFAIVIQCIDHPICWPLAERAALMTWCMWVLCSVVGCSGYLPFHHWPIHCFFHKVKKKSNVHKQHLIGWFCHCFVGWGPFFKWMNLSYNSYLTALKQNRIRLTK